MLDQVHADRRDAARSALMAAFGTVPLSALEPITTGASALIYRIEVGGRPWLLRLESLRRDEVRDPERAYLCMQAAAEAGIAPELLQADPVAGVAIMAFVEGRPLSDYPGASEALARDLGTLAARIQALPAFPAVSDYPTVVGGMLAQVFDSGLYGAGLLDSHRDGFERIRKAYPLDASTLVSSHNDPHPGNILFDGARLWLIDLGDGVSQRSGHRSGGHDPCTWPTRPTCRRRYCGRGAAAPPIRCCAPACS